MSAYRVEYQVHERQVRDDDWIGLDVSEVDAHDWFDRYQGKPDIVAVRVVRIDRSIVREWRSGASDTDQ